MSQESSKLVAPIVKVVVCIELCLTLVLCSCCFNFGSVLLDFLDANGRVCLVVSLTEGDVCLVVCVDMLEDGRVIP